MSLTISKSERSELLALADVVIRGSLCSTLFPAFVQGYQDDTGHEPGGTVKRIAAGIRRTHERRHLSAHEIAEILRAAAEHREDHSCP